MANILLIDDDEDLAAAVGRDLEASGHPVEWLEQAASGADRLEAGKFQVVVVDNLMPGGMTGLEFLTELCNRGVKVPVILMTGESSSQIAIQATKLGAFGYVIKADTYRDLARDLLQLVEKAIECNAQVPEVHLTSKPGRFPTSGLALISNRNRRMVDEVALPIGRLADTSIPVLVLGERGTGKELVARALHTNSSRKSKPFVALNCSTIPEGMLASELFGHEKDAFPGAQFRKGMFEQADGGTLFLDEIGEMPFELQARLLRVLQPVREADGSEYQEFTRLGTKEATPTRVNVRVVSATNQDLNAMVEAGKFRGDLRDRLNMSEIRLPPLRERLDDLPDLVEYFLHLAAHAAGRPCPGITPETLQKLQSHRWPGNVCELQNVMFAAFNRCRGSRILPADIVFEQAKLERPAACSSQVPTSEEEARAALRKVLAWAWETTPEDVWPRVHDLLECELLRLALERCSGNQTEIANRVGMVWNTVSKRMKSYGLK